MKAEIYIATKYLGGHSDLLAGVLVVKTEAEWRDIWNIRVNIGNNAVSLTRGMEAAILRIWQGSLDSWLLLRSLRTLSLRVGKQSKNATELATWLDKVANTKRGKSFDGIPGGVVAHVWHGSLQDKTNFDPAKQQEGGFGPTFAILVNLFKD